MRIFEVHKYYRKKVFSKADKDVDDLIGYFKNQDRAMFYIEELAQHDRDFGERSNKSWTYADDYSNMFKANKASTCWFQILIHDVPLMDEGL